MPEASRSRSTRAGRWGWSRRALLGWRWLDPETLTVYVLSLIFLVGGVVSLALHALTPSWLGDSYQAWMSFVALTIGVLGPAMPWERWPTRATLVFPIAGLVIIAFGTPSDPSGVGAALTILALVFVAVGVTQPPGTSLMLALPALIAIAVGHSHWTMMARGSVALALPLSITAGEAVAQIVARQRRAERRVEQLLAAVRELARIEDERIGVGRLCDLSVDLLGADASVILLARPGRPDGLVNRARGGHPALADRVPLVVDLAERLRPVQALLLPDDTDGFVPREGTRGRASALLLPMKTDDGELIGVIVTLWGRRVDRLPEPIVQTGQLVAQEGARMLARLRVTQRLEHEAETDPLTDLANRRTFMRALDRLSVGDAVIVIDLDHFKDVNDRYGHDAGDDTLRTFARCLHDVSRQNDIVCRLGGEEFGLVLPAAGVRGGLNLLRRMRERWSEAGLVTTFSAGLAPHKKTCSALETFRDADQALYRAKHLGRDRDEIAESDIDLDDGAEIDVRDTGLLLP